MEPINLTTVKTYPSEVKPSDPEVQNEGGFDEILTQQCPPVKETLDPEDKTAKGEGVSAEEKMSGQSEKSSIENETEPASSTIPIDMVQYLLAQCNVVIDHPLDTMPVNTVPETSSLSNMTTPSVMTATFTFISNQNDILPTDSSNSNMKLLGQVETTPVPSDIKNIGETEESMLEPKQLFKQEDVIPLPPLEAKRSEGPLTSPVLPDSMKIPGPSKGIPEEGSPAADAAIALQTMKDAKTEEMTIPSSEKMGLEGINQPKPDRPLVPSGPMSMQSSGTDAAIQSKENIPPPALEVNSNPNLEEGLQNQNKSSLNASVTEEPLPFLKNGESGVSSSNSWTMEKDFMNFSFSNEGKGAEKIASEKNSFAAIAETKNETGQTPSMILGDGKGGTEIRTVTTGEISKNSEAAPPKADFAQIYQQIGNKAIFSLRNSEERIRLTLDPPELGSIYMEINRDKGNIKATLWTDNPVTKEILEAHQVQLHKILKDDGFKLEKFDVLFQQDMGSFQDRQKKTIDEEQWKQGRPNSAGLLKPIESFESGPKTINLYPKGNNSVDVFV